jgi:hypothetical protein
MWSQTKTISRTVKTRPITKSRYSALVSELLKLDRDMPAMIGKQEVARYK